MASHSLTSPVNLREYTGNPSRRRDITGRISRMSGGDTPRPLCPRRMPVTAVIVVSNGGEVARVNVGNTSPREWRVGARRSGYLGLSPTLSTRIAFLTPSSRITRSSLVTFCLRWLASTRRQHARSPEMLWGTFEHVNKTSIRNTPLQRHRTESARSRRTGLAAGSSRRPAQLPIPIARE
jgi:hypothetical protein